MTPFKRRKQDYEDALWSELQGNEAAIKELLNRNGQIRTELTHKMIKEERAKAKEK